jgi:hypothetical protein
MNNDHLDSLSTHGPTTVVSEDTRPVGRGMVLPFIPLSLVFDNIRYSVDMPPVIDIRMLVLNNHHQLFSLVCNLAYEIRFRK